MAVAVITAVAACGADAEAPTLTWYINPDDGGQAEIAERCTQEADGQYRIETSLLPREASAQREQLARRLAANDSSIDLMSLDPPFIPEFAEAGFLAQIPSDVAGVVTEDVVQSAIDGATWKDELVAAPFWANTQILWYRKSVAEEAGLDPQQEPVTWDEIIDAAREHDAYIGVQGIRAEALTVWINALVESAGGQIITDTEVPVEDVELGLDSPAGRAAAEVVGTIGREGLGGPGLPNQDEPGAMMQFRGDRGSFMVNWPFVWAATIDAVEEGTLDEAVLDDIGWTMYPAMEPGEQPRPPYGGINIGIGAFTEHEDAALDAVQCIVAPENQAFYFVNDGNPAAHTAAYDDPEVREVFPMADVIRESLEVAAPRPQTPYYNEVSTGIQNTWHPPAAVRPDQSPETATNLILDVLRGERLL
ncbi:extracellular solute-binding protein [Actinobacteria bacterium YIM 96077]|uniref:ABC transporter substrate-binding protein n=2 Tax=Phytoactinopolyspora halophila TaxID=1981511 RepID=A0A329QHP9_9ACTN|nr:extracellular solute-binding protein [Actinobacteria bacterium YIM 96077]RAW11927.1 ABC transporter substrate-binding protein [Phytoactinopolyspora halophila]